MLPDHNLWDQARLLRACGWSLRRIARHLDVSLSSASVWTRDVVRIGPPASPPAEPGTAESLEPVRRCSRCSVLLPASSFNRLGSGLQSWCRGCFRAYYRERRAHHRQRSNALKRRRVLAARQFMLRWLDAHPCSDCGERDTIVLEFDHLGDKRAEISTLVLRGVRVAEIEREIAGCQVVCANCHRRRTAERAGWRRLDPGLEGAPWRSAREERNVRHALAILRASGCVDCGVKDLCILDFDHVGAKRAGVMRLARDEASLARLDEEIARCEVRCANCHRRRTAVRAGHFRARSGGVPPARIELALTP